MKSKKSSRISSAKQLRDEKVIIASEYYENDRPSCICSFCNQTLIRLTDSGQNNTTYWCRHCSVEFDPVSENLRKESKIIVPDRNVEPAVATTPGIPDISIKKELELSSTFKALQRKGLKITHYEEHNPK
jgi:hypothetical protein